MVCIDGETIERPARRDPIHVFVAILSAETKRLHSDGWRGAGGGLTHCTGRERDCPFQHKARGGGTHDIEHAPELRTDTHLGTE